MSYLGGFSAFLFMAVFISFPEPQWHSSFLFLCKDIIVLCMIFHISNCESENSEQ